VAAVALTYSRAYRLTRAILDPGPGRLQVRGRFTRLVDGLSVGDQHALHGQLAGPDPSVLVVIDPRPTIRTAGAIQNTYALSLLQAETLAAAVVHDPVLRPRQRDRVRRRAAGELGLDLAVIGP